MEFTKSSLWSTVVDVIETIVVAAAIFVVVYLFLLQPHQVKGASMEPNFHDGEYILTDKISYRFSEPKRGDVVVFKAPTNPDVDFIKRIVQLLEKRDQWMVRFSRAVGKNLSPFFQAWGVPTTEKSRTSIADLPGWMPDGFPPAKMKAAKEVGQ